MDCIEAVEAGVAPRISIGLDSMRSRISNGSWYTRRVLEIAITSTDLKLTTARSIIRAAEKHGIIESRPVDGSGTKRKTRGGKFTTVMKREYRIKK